MPVPSEIATSAMQAKQQVFDRTVFGKVAVDYEYIVLRKGEGRQKFDPAKHREDERRINLKFSVTGFPKDAESDAPVYDRGMLTQSNDWIKFAKPSLEKIGYDLNSIDGKYVQALLKPTGQKWTSNRTGEEMISTTFVFQQVFGGEQECREASDEFWRKIREARDAGAADAAAENGAAPAAPTTPGEDPQKKTAQAFLKPLWAKANGSVSDFGDLMAKNPMVSKHFDLNSPEVIAIITGQA